VECQQIGVVLELHICGAPLQCCVMKIVLKASFKLLFVMRNTMHDVLSASPVMSDAPESLS
jgi:hypothetical protein